MFSHGQKKVKGIDFDSQGAECDVRKDNVSYTCEYLRKCGLIKLYTVSLNKRLKNKILE
jgi:hypothetical protein